MGETTQGTVMMLVRLKSDLPHEELMRRAEERMPEFRAVPGLVQKYYVQMGPGQYGGFYIWDSKEFIAAFRETELARTIPLAYEVTEPPQIEIVDLITPLRT